MPDRIAYITAVSWMVSVATLYVIRLVGSSLYDFEQIQKQKERIKRPNAKQYRKKPVISVVVVAQNHEDTIESTLDSITKSTYKKYEVTVVDNASVDSTAVKVKDFIKKHKKSPVRLVSKRKPVLLKSAIDSALGKRSKGTLIMILDGSSILGKQALKTAFQHFAEEDISVLAPNKQIRDYPGLIGLMQQFEQPLIAQNSKLGLGVDSADITGGYGVIYKKAAYSRLKRFIGVNWANRKELSQASRSFSSKTLPSYFASDVVVAGAPIMIYKDLLRNYYLRIAGSIKTLGKQARLFTPLHQPGLFRRLRPILGVLSGLTLLIEPLVVAYFAYLAINFKQPIYYLIVWLGMTALLGLAVLKEEPTWRLRLKKAVLLPIMYNLLLIVRLMQIGAFLAYALNFKNWTSKKNKTTKKPVRKTASKTAKKTKKRSKLAVA